MEKNLAAFFESLVQGVSGDVLNEERKHFREFLLVYYKNVYSSKNYTYFNLRRLIKCDTSVVTPGYKDSCVAIIYKVDNVTNEKEIINIGIQKGVYAKTEDNALREQKYFQYILYRNFKSNKFYKRIAKRVHCKILFTASKNTKIRKILEPRIQALKRSSLNEQFILVY